MRTRVILLTACLCLGMAAFSSGSADMKVWVSPLNAVTGVAGLNIEPGPPGPSIRVTTDSAGDYKWVEIPLQLPAYAEVDSFTICYELSDASSYIKTVRFAHMTTPDAVTVGDYTPDLADPGPSCHADRAPYVLSDGTISLRLRLEFASTDHWIDIGGISLSLITPPAAIGDDPDGSEPSRFHLGQNSPNPFGRTTVIEYALDQDKSVDLEIYDVSGRTIRSFDQGHQAAGLYRVMWDGRDDHGREMASGKYYYRVRVGDQADTRGMILLR